jgi:hypothetical protein
MPRLRFLSLPLVLLGVAAGAFSATGASFTDETTLTYELGAGSLGIERNGDGLVFDSAPLAPGGVSRASVTVTNDSPFAAELVLTHEEESSTPGDGCAVRDALQLRVVEDLDRDLDTTGDRDELTDEPLKTAPATIPLRPFAAGAARTYVFEVTFVAQGGATADSNDNCFQGSKTTERFAWQSMEAQS